MGVFAAFEMTRRVPSIARPMSFSLTASPFGIPYGGGQVRPSASSLAAPSVFIRTTVHGSRCSVQPDRPAPDGSARNATRRSVRNHGPLQQRRPMTTDDLHEDPITPARFDALVAFLLARLNEDEAAARTVLLNTN